MVMAWIKGLTLWHAVAIAVGAFLAARYVITGGLLNALLWIVAIGALAIGVINKVSYD